jgi:hopanoid C-2 methylase
MHHARGGRHALLVYPHFGPNNFLAYEHMCGFYPGKRAVMPPLGLLTFAPLLVERGWRVRLVDENVQRLDASHLEWADAVFFSGMHPQKARLNRLLQEAKARGRLTVVGGPSANICPEYYPAADAVHQGEIGDATTQLLDWMDVLAPGEKPLEQQMFRTSRKTPLDEQPLPAFEICQPNRYLVAPLQFSVGCPYTCEFCDIPAIYGRVARLKSPERVVDELTRLYRAGFVGTILFVDDNLIANRKAFTALLPDVIRWQTDRRFPYPLTGEASADIARAGELLTLMHDARFTHLFVGVESPDPATLISISKRQNVRDPVVESLRTIQRHGMEVILGMIFGFDTDTAETGARIRAFVAETNASIVYFNLLTALPKTPLWERLEREGRLLSDGDDARSSERMLSCMSTNVKYKLGNEVVRRMLMETVRDVYSARAVYRRMLWNCDNVYGAQRQGRPPSTTFAQAAFVLWFAAGTLVKVLVGLGVKAPQRREFWKFVAAVVTLRLRGRVASVLEIVLRVTPNAHHLITWGDRLREDHERMTTSESRFPHRRRPELFGREHPFPAISHPRTHSGGRS